MAITDSGGRHQDISSFDNNPKDYSDPNNPPWVLADGDPTGFSFHMDFVRWDLSTRHSYDRS